MVAVASVFPVVAAVCPILAVAFPPAEVSPVVVGAELAPAPVVPVLMSRVLLGQNHPGVVVVPEVVV